MEKEHGGENVANINAHHSCTRVKIRIFYAFFVQNIVELHWFLDDRSVRSTVHDVSSNQYQISIYAMSDSSFSLLEHELNTIVIHLYTEKFITDLFSYEFYTTYFLVPFTF